MPTDLRADTRQHPPTPRSPLLQAVRVLNASTWHLTWRTDGKNGESAVTCCGLGVQTAQWGPASRWLENSPTGRCQPCDAMSGVLLSRAIELDQQARFGYLPDRDLRLETQMPTAAELTAGLTPTAPDPEWPPTPPTSLRIGAHLYTLEVDTTKVRKWALEEHGTDRYAGYSDSWSLEIAVASEFPNGQTVPLAALQETVLHEVLHMLLRAGHWDGDDIGHLPPSDREEYTVRALASELYVLLRAHPELTAYLVAK